MVEDNLLNGEDYLWTDNVLAIILGGGRGSRLYNLTKKRSKPALAFGGEPRIIDVKLTRLVEASIRHIQGLVEYEPISLIKHFRRWHDKESNNGYFIYAMPNKKSDIDGIAEALYNQQYERHPRQLGFVPSEYFVLTGDHATDLDMRKFLRSHRDNKADVTIAVKPVPVSRARNSLGAVLFDEDMGIYRFDEKSANPPSVTIDGKEISYASLMDSIWKPDVLENVLAQYRPGCGNSYDLSKDVLTPMIREGKYNIRAYVHEGYWADVGVLDELIREVLALTKEGVGLELKNIKTYSDKVFTGPIIRCEGRFDSKVSAGDVIDVAEATGCVFGYNVTVSKGTIIRNSIISDDAIIQRNALVEDSYLDKNIHVGDGAIITPGSLDVHIEGGNIVGPNRNGYKCKPLGGSKTTPPDHLLLQKSFCGRSVEDLIGIPDECEGNEVFIPELTIESNPCLEMVITPENRVVVSRYSQVPEGYRI
jgi:glucose-1-phosphate adenylyltransferase